jgi:hypothetical protein
MRHPIPRGFLPLTCAIDAWYFMTDHVGYLQVDEEQRPMNYTQAFQLAQDASGQYFVFNDIFKLVYG